MSEVIINALVELTMSVVFLLISTVVIPAVFAWLRSKTENEKLKAVIGDIEKTTQTSVDMLEQTMVKQFKVDGEWNVKAQKQVLEVAVSEVVENLTASTIKYLQSENTNIRDIATRYIESYIASKKIPEMTLIEE